MMGHITSHITLHGWMSRHNIIMQKFIQYGGLMIRHGDYYQMSGAVVNN